MGSLLRVRERAKHSNRKSAWKYALYMRARMKHAQATAKKQGRAAALKTAPKPKKGSSMKLIRKHPSQSYLNSDPTKFMGEVSPL